MREPKRLLIAVLIIAALVRSIPVLVAWDNPALLTSGDTQEFQSLAQDLGGGYLSSDGPLAVTGIRRTPGYPSFLSLVFVVNDDNRVVAVVQIILSLITLWLVYLIGQRFDERVGLIAAAIVALDVPSVIYSGFVLSDTLFTSLLVASLYCCLQSFQTRSAAWALATGLSLSLSLLTRPIGLYVVLPLMLLSVWTMVKQRDLLKLMTVFWLAFLLPLGGWLIRNQVVTGHLLFSTSESTNLLQLRAAGALAEERGVTPQEVQAELFVLVDEQLDPSLKEGVALPNTSRVQTATDPRVAADIAAVEKRVALDVIKQHPKGIVITTAKGAVKTLLAPTHGTWMPLVGREVTSQSVRSPINLLPIALEVIFTGSLLIGAAVGLVILWREGERHLVVAAILLIGYFVLASAGPEANSRFRHPIVPALALLSGFAIDRIRTPRATTD